jgi:hypothetical protein
MAIKFEHNSLLLLSAQRALLGAIYPEIRAVAVGIDADKLYIKYYLDRLPVEGDYENLGIVGTEIFADFCNDIKGVEEICEYSLAPFNQLDRLMGFVYMRKED